MNPDSNTQSTPNQYSPNSAQAYGTGNSPGSSPQQPHNYDSSSSKSKKIMMVLAALIGIFIIVAAVVFLTGGDNTPQQAPVEQSASPENLFKEPTAIELENLNNSVSDDITNMSTDTDFPTDKLSDEKLEL